MVADLFSAGLEVLTTSTPSPLTGDGELAARTYEAGAKQVSDHWRGKAEESFQDYARGQVEAMDWEGPVGRLTKEALDAAGTGDPGRVR